MNPRLPASLLIPSVVFGLLALPACGRPDQPPAAPANGAAGQAAPDPALAAGILAYEAGDYTAARAKLEPLVSAGKGGGDAAFLCGLMHQHGRGGKADPAAAARCYLQGASTGHDQCMNNLGVLYRDGAGVAQDFAAAADWFRKAALLGNDDAQLSLGALFVNGDGVARDYAEAAAWYRIAIDSGNTVAAANLDQLRGYMDDRQVAAAEARAAALKAEITAARRARDAARGPVVHAGRGSDLSPATGAVPPASRTHGPGPVAAQTYVWRELKVPSGVTGSVLLAQPNVGGSAVDLLRLGADALAERLGKRPMLLGAVEVFDGSIAHAPFDAEGRRRGVLLAQSRGQAGIATIAAVFDDTDAFAASAARLLETAAGHFPAMTGTKPAGSPPETVWQTVPLPDGTGSVRLPQGWVITGAYQGIVDAHGPEGAISLGAFFQVMVPQAAAQYMARAPLVAPYNDPESAARSVLQQLGQTAQQTGQVWIELGRVREKNPVEWPGGQAIIADVDFEVLGLASGQVSRVPRRGLVLWGMAPVNNEQFLFYQSAVSSPPEQFARNLPVLLEIWKGWRVSDATLRGRLDAAARSLRETNQILSDVNARRQDAMERSSMAWDHYIRGTWPVEDTLDGRRYTGDNDTLKPIVEWLNQQEGHERWKIVPYDQLNR